METPPTARAYRPAPDAFRPIPARVLADAFPRPQLAIVVDTEEEFDWSRPLARSNRSVRNILCQDAAQAVFAEYGAVATYVIDHPVAADPAAARVMRRYAESGTALVGAHLHPWVTPPDDEAVTPFNSYAGNLPPELERAKLAGLSDLIAEAVGTRPTVYKAGRYGFGPATAASLADLGYLVDTSMVAHTDFGADGGPDYTALDPRPRWLATEPEILALPTTAGFAGRARAAGPRLFDRIHRDWRRRLKLPGVLARAGLLERIRLTPEGTSLAEMRRLTTALLEDGVRVFCLAYHSSSLMPGGSPYAATALDVQDFVGRLRGYCDFFVRELGGVAATPPALRARLERDRPR